MKKALLLVIPAAALAIAATALGQSNRASGPTRAGVNGSSQITCGKTRAIGLMAPFTSDGRYMSRPCIPGICISTIAISYCTPASCRARSCSTPWGPFAVLSGCMPHARNCFSSTARDVALSADDLKLGDLGALSIRSRSQIAA